MVAFIVQSFVYSVKRAIWTKKKRLWVLNSSGGGSLSISLQCSMDKKVWEPLL